MHVTVMLAFAAAVAAAAAGSLPAWAAGPNDACVNQVNGAYDAVASQNWQDHFRNTDQNAVQMIAGTWYTEIRNQQLGMIAYTYESYLPTQIFDYRQRTCSATGCSDAYGTGMFGAETQADGSVFVTRNFSDNNRRNACGGFYVRFLDRNTMVTQDGGRYSRAQ
jgi:hypothetical protein